MSNTKFSEKEMLKIALCEIDKLKQRVSILEDGGGPDPEDEVIPLTIPFTIA